MDLATVSNVSALTAKEQQGMSLEKTLGNGKLPKSQKELMSVAQDFEAVFIQRLLEAMDKTIEHADDGPLGGGAASETFRGMLYENIAKVTAKSPSGGIGLAKHIYQQAKDLLPAESSTSSPTEDNA